MKGIQDEDARYLIKLLAQNIGGEACFYGSGVTPSLFAYSGERKNLVAKQNEVDTLWERLGAMEEYLKIQYEEGGRYEQRKSTRIKNN